MDILLLGIESFIFIIGLTYIFHRDRFFGIYWFFLFVYAIFAQIGYLYFSEISVSLQAYFGEAIWYTSTTFIIFSFTTFLTFFILFRTRFIQMALLSIKIKNNRNNSILITMVIFWLGLVLFELFYYIANFNDINWYTAGDEKYIASNSLFAVFIWLFKFMVPVIFSLYSIIRNKEYLLPKQYYWFSLIMTVSFFLIIGFSLGNRTNILDLALGITVFELYKVSFTWKISLKILFFSLILIGFLTILETHRYTDTNANFNLAFSILNQDYYSPAHILFAVIAYSFINPLEVITTNFCNSLILLNHPYLQATVMELFRPGVASRTSSYSFYILAEGYMVLGYLGFIYNGFILMLGLSLWRRLALSNSKSFNLFLIGLMSCMLIDLVRGESSFFIKFLYTFIFPGIVFYCGLSGKSFSLYLGNKETLSIANNNP